jgi:integrase
MLKANTPLARVIEQYLEDAKEELAPSTWQPYSSRLRGLLVMLSADLAKDALRRGSVMAEPTLADLVPANFTTILRTLKNSGHVYSARGKAIALRALGTYLAKGEYWYIIDREIRVSVMHDLVIPEMPATGRPVYEDRDLLSIREVASAHPTRPYFHTAMQFVYELGLRAGFEAMTLAFDDVHLPTGRHDPGYVQIREENTKTEAGIRKIPLEPAVTEAIQRYVRMERPRYAGQGKEVETMFLTVDGLNHGYSGWNSMLQRFRRLVLAHDPEVHFQASRHRGTRTLKLRETGEYNDSEIMQLMGWSSPKMIRRYSGAVPMSAFRGRRGTTGAIAAAPRRRTA